jgi:hypothetical protein
MLHQATPGRTMVGLRALAGLLVVSLPLRCTCARVFTLSSEFLGGYVYTTGTPYFENETVVEERIDWFKGVVARAENTLAGTVDDDLALTDDLTLDGLVRLAGPLWVGPALRFLFTETRSAFGIEALVVLEKVLPRTGTTLSDENRLRYSLSDENLVYRNEVDIVQPFGLTPNTAFYIALENDLTVGDETTNLLLLGPGITVGMVSVFSNYVMALTGEGRVEHGVEGGVVVEL